MVVHFSAEYRLLDPHITFGLGLHLALHQDLLLHLAEIVRIDLGGML